MAEPKKLLDMANNITASIGKIHRVWYKMSFGVALFTIGLKLLWDCKK